MEGWHLEQKLSRFIEREIPPETVDLWPTICGRAQAAAPVEYPQRRRPLGVRPAVAAALLILLAAGLLSAPVARAAREAIEHRFGLALGDSPRDGLAPPRTAGPTAGTPMVVVSPPANLAAAQAQIPFALRAPSWLPADLILAQTFATNQPLAIGGTTQQVARANLFYRPVGQAAGGNGGQVMINITDHPEVAPTYLPRSRARATSVNGRPALYVHGGWRADGQGDPTERRGDLRWDDGIDSAWLSWEDGGLTYTVATQGLGLGQADLLRIAESLR